MYSLTIYYRIDLDFSQYLNEKRNEKLTYSYFILCISLIITLFIKKSLQNGDFYFFNIPFNTKATFAGRSANRRIKYPYQSVPNGT